MTEIIMSIIGAIFILNDKKGNDINLMSPKRPYMPTVSHSSGLSMTHFSDKTESVVVNNHSVDSVSLSGGIPFFETTKPTSTTTTGTPIISTPVLKVDPVTINPSTSTSVGTMTALKAFP
jgi:hypothetical protein